MDDKFFEKLVEFLPKHVSPMKSYAHGAIGFIVAYLIAYAIGGQFFILDFDQDDAISETERRAQDGIRIAIAVLVALFVSDLVFNISWRRRNFSINKNHITYKRWFTSLY